MLKPNWIAVFYRIRRVWIWQKYPFLLCMSQIQGCPFPPPRLIPGHLTFFCGQIPHYAGPFLGKMPPRDIFQGSNALPPRLKWQNPDWFQETWTKFSTLPFLLFFVYQFNVYVHHFVYCVRSDHLGSRYELSAFGTLQSSVSRQEEVQEHKSVHSKFCNSRVFSEGSLPSGFNYWQRSKSFVKCTYLCS